MSTALIQLATPTLACGPTLDILFVPVAIGASVLAIGGLSIGAAVWAIFTLLPD